MAESQYQSKEEVEAFLRHADQGPRVSQPITRAEYAVLLERLNMIDVDEIIAEWPEVYGVKESERAARVVQRKKEKYDRYNWHFRRKH